MSYQANWSILKRPNVQKIFIALLITHIGTAMAPIAMAFGVLELTGSTKQTAYVMAASTVATILVLLIGGAVADRTSRQKVIIFADLFAMLVQALIAYLFLAGNANIGFLAVLMLFNGIALAFNAPAMTGLMVQVVEKEHLQSLNAIAGLARNAAHVGGAVLGGVLVATIGAGWTFVIDALSFAVSAGLFASLTLSAQSKAVSSSIAHELKLGWREFCSHRWIWAIVLQFAFVLAAYQAVIAVVGPAIAINQYAGAASWGYIMAAFGAGLFLGGVIGIKIQPRFPIRFASFCVFSAAFIPLALAFALPIEGVVMVAFASGVLWELFGIIWVSTLQQKIAPEMLSRISAYDYIGSIGLAPVGILLGGYFYERFGAFSVTFTAAGVIIVATTAVLMVREVWQLTAETR